MKLDVVKLPINRRAHLFTDCKETEARALAQEFQPNTWVKLSELPSPFSFEEALLLCQISDRQWIVWIPEYGEATLDTSQFCQI